MTMVTVVSTKYCVNQMSADQMSVDEMSLGQKVFRQKCVELFEQGAEKYFLLKKRLSKKKPQPLTAGLVEGISHPAFSKARLEK